MPEPGKNDDDEITIRVEATKAMYQLYVRGFMDGRAAAIGAVLKVVGVMLLVLVIALLTSCAGRVHDRPVESAQDALASSTWCVVATIGKRRLVACTDSYEACRVWRRQAREKGRWVGVTKLSSCEPVAAGRGE